MKFIELEGGIDPNIRQNASYARRAFQVPKPLRAAKLIITACGIYRAFVNGEELDEQVFLPGCTYYRKRVQYQEYDVTSHIRPGENAIGVIVGDGWYRGEVGAGSKTNVYGEKTKLAVALEIEYEDGTAATISTDDRWKTTQNGPIRFNDLKAGEDYDADREMPGWSSAHFDDSEWREVYPSSYDGDTVPSEGEKILEHERFNPSVFVTPDDSTVLDFGQNIFGYIEFTVRGKKGDRVKLLHGETLDEYGNFTTKNLFLLKRQKEKRFQEINYTLKDGVQKYKPTFSAHGFRYAKVVDWPEPVDAENFSAVAVYSDMKETGFFECSHPLINRLVNNTMWSQKGNFLDIPTDCPTRERAGWTGDIEVYCETAAYLMDVRKFLAKWLKDLAAQQYENGCIPSIVPDVGMKIGDGSAGWADACIIVPYKLYQIYGDVEILKSQYPSMKKWMGFLEKRAKENSLFRIFKRNPYRQFTIETGFHFGEWLEPGHSMIRDSLKAFIVADAEVATAYYAYAAGLMSEIAGILNLRDDAGEYDTLSKNIKEGYRYNFTDGGIVRSDRLCRFVRPVALNLLSEVEKRQNVKRINEIIIENDYRIMTGFLTTQSILPVLTDYGYAETAYRMVENTKSPGWLYNITKGATTIWEDWEGVNESGVPKNSFNHYAFGTVVEWLFKTVAGIAPIEPGYRKVRIKPVPGGSLSYVNCTYHSAAGPIGSSWKIDDGEFELKTQLPVEGEIHMPDGETHRVSKGEYTHRCRMETTSHG